MLERHACNFKMSYIKNYYNLFFFLLGYLKGRTVKCIYASNTKEAQHSTEKISPKTALLQDSTLPSVMSSAI